MARETDKTTPVDGEDNWLLNQLEQASKDVSEMPEWMQKNLRAEAEDWGEYEEYIDVYMSPGDWEEWVDVREE